MNLSLKFLILLTVISCSQSSKFEDGPRPRVQGSLSLTDIDFDLIKKEILEPSCLKCHGDYSSYDVVFAARNKILDSVEGNRMPKNSAPLNNELKNLLKTWIDNGAPLGNQNNSNEPSKELVATWESVSTKVIFPKCVQCHNPEGQASFLDLSTRQKFFEQRHELLNNFEDVKNSYLIQVINDPDEPMPPVWSDIERLNETEVKILIEWIQKGLP